MPPVSTLVAFLTPAATFERRGAGLRTFSRWIGCGQGQWTGSSVFATGMHLSVFCTEDVPFTTDEEIASVTANSILGESLFRRYQEACELWPRGEVAADFHDAVRSGLPALIVSGERDPATPPLWGERVAGSMTDAVHLVIPGAGHVPITFCVTEGFVALVRDGATAAIPRSCPAG